MLNILFIIFPVYNILHYVYWWYWNDSRILVLICRNYIFQRLISCIIFCSYFARLCIIVRSATLDKNVLGHWLFCCMSMYQFFFHYQIVLNFENLVVFCLNFIYSFKNINFVRQWLKNVIKFQHKKHIFQQQKILTSNAIFLLHKLNDVHLYFS